MAIANGVEEEVKEKKNDFIQKSIVEINNDNNSKHQPNAIQYKTLCFIFTMSNWFVFIRIEYTLYSIQYTVYRAIHNTNYTSLYLSTQ